MKSKKVIGILLIAALLLNSSFVQVYASQSVSGNSISLTEEPEEPETDSVSANDVNVENTAEPDDSCDSMENQESIPEEETENPEVADAAEKTEEPEDRNVRTLTALNESTEQTVSNMSKEELRTRLDLYFHSETPDRSQIQPKDGYHFSRDELTLGEKETVEIHLLDSQEQEVSGVEWYVYTKNPFDDLFTVKESQEEREPVNFGGELYQKSSLVRINDDSTVTARVMQGTGNSMYGWIVGVYDGSYANILPVFVEKEEKVNKAKEVEAKIQEILASMEGLSDADKVVFAYEYLADHIVYTDSESGNPSLHDIFIKGKAVCEGYARGFKYLMDRSGIKAEVQIEEVNGGETHAWNRVYVEDGWYYLDATWGDQVFSDDIDYDYLFASRDFMLESRKIPDDGKNLGKKYLNYRGSNPDVDPILHLSMEEQIRRAVNSLREGENKCWFFFSENISCDLQNVKDILNSTEGVTAVADPVLEESMKYPGYVYSYVISYHPEKSTEVTAVFPEYPIIDETHFGTVGILIHLDKNVELDSSNVHVDNAKKLSLAVKEPYSEEKGISYELKISDIQKNTVSVELTKTGFRFITEQKELELTGELPQIPDASFTGAGKDTGILKNLKPGDFYNLGDGKWTRADKNEILIKPYQGLIDPANTKIAAKILIKNSNSIGMFSKPQEIKIFKAPATPDWIKVAYDRTDENKVVNTAGTEYRNVKEDTWTVCRGNAVLNLPKGDYEFRTKGKTDKFASESVMISIHNLVPQEKEQAELTLDGISSPVYGETYTVTAGGGSGNGKISVKVLSSNAVLNGNSLTITEAGKLTVRVCREADETYKEKVKDFTFNCLPAEIQTGQVSCTLKEIYPSTTGSEIEKALTSDIKLVPGKFVIDKNSGFPLKEGTQEISWQYVPDDSVNYRTAEGTVTVTVLKEKPEPENPDKPEIKPDKPEVKPEIKPDKPESSLKPDKPVKPDISLKPDNQKKPEKQKQKDLPKKETARPADKNQKPSVQAEKSDSSSDVIVKTPELNVSLADSLAGEKKKDVEAFVETVMEGMKTRPMVEENQLKEAGREFRAENQISAEEAQKIIKEKLNPGSGNVEKTRVVTQYYYDLKVVGKDEDDSFTLDISPMARTVVTYADDNQKISLDGKEANAVAVGNSEKLSFREPVEMTFPMIKKFRGETRLFIEHLGYVYSGNVIRDGEREYIRFTNPHGFSEFTFSKDNHAAAAIGDMGYMEIGKAVEELKDGDTLTLLQPTDEDLYVDRELVFRLEGENFTGNVRTAEKLHAVLNDGVYTVSKMIPAEEQEDADVQETEETDEKGGSRMPLAAVTTVIVLIAVLTAAAAVLRKRKKDKR